ncbi:hypothetical protein M758_7G044300 [Ceratodon purpureus]|uniref:Secreted protein n=1 Tax=Ceratodon purpureus TaxID=3225 RepID=A0A8T0H688_CERPU|nr:hypothetical protein KC19_7G047500 [Ceratodon purpureus]KAG0610181.1 hypothetical protein M758_7G044300 [Ceratodon purpureus]
MHLRGSLALRFLTATGLHSSLATPRFFPCRKRTVFPLATLHLLSTSLETSSSGVAESETATRRVQ